MKLLKLSENVWFCELWNSITFDGHWGVYFTHKDWTVTDLCIAKIGYFAEFTVYKEAERVIIMDEFNTEQYKILVDHIRRTVDYYLHNYQDPLKTSQPHFYPTLADIEAIRYFGDELGGDEYYEYTTMWRTEFLPLDYTGAIKKEKV